MSTRETIVTTLLNLLDAASDVTVSSRQFKAFDEVAQGDFPYLILLQDREIFDTTMPEMGAAIGLHKMQFKVLLYALGDGTEDALPATALNNMVDSIEGALRPLGLARTQNLGLPYVNWAFINGPVEYDGSAFGNFGIAVIPIEVAYS